MSKPNCYECIHRRDLPGDAHSCCMHPEAGSLDVTGDRHGIRNGWFMWPFNFDPVWLQSCDGFIAKWEPTFVVNGAIFHPPGPLPTVTYAEIATMAGFDPSRKPTITVFHNATKHHATMLPGENVTLLDGMIFNVAHT